MVFPDLASSKEEVKFSMLMKLDELVDGVVAKRVSLNQIRYHLHYN